MGQETKQGRWWWPLTVGFGIAVLVMMLAYAALREFGAASPPANVSASTQTASPEPPGSAAADTAGALPVRMIGAFIPRITDMSGPGAAASYALISFGGAAPGAFRLGTQVRPGLTLIELTHESATLLRAATGERLVLPAAALPTGWSPSTAGPTAAPGGRPPAAMQVDAQPSPAPITRPHSNERVTQPGVLPP